MLRGRAEYSESSKSLDNSETTAERNAASRRRDMLRVLNGIARLLLVLEDDAIYDDADLVLKSLAARWRSFLIKFINHEPRDELTIEIIASMAAPLRALRLM